MPVTRTDRNQTLDGNGNLVHEELVEADVTEEVITLDLHWKARAALATNATFLGLTSPNQLRPLPSVTTPAPNPSAGT